MEIWDEKSADTIVSGDHVWRKLYLPLLPKKIGPVGWGFAEYQWMPNTENMNQTILGQGN